jgi:transcriptional regulator with XRE-family HTH domain
MKTEERFLARELRAAGWSIKEIERQLSVSRSSVSLWVRDVELGPEQQERLLAKTRLGPLIAAERKAAAAREIRRGYQDEGRSLAPARGEIYAAGCMLYWAEGSKGRNTVKLTNSDPDLLAYFLRFLREHFSVPNRRVRIACNLFADHVERQHEIEDFWLSRLALSRESLRTSTVNTYSKYSQKKRTNQLPYGTTALIVHSTRIAQTIYGSIQELGAFERPEWLG